MAACHTHSPPHIPGRPNRLLGQGAGKLGHQLPPHLAGQLPAQAHRLWTQARQPRDSEWASHSSPHAAARSHVAPAPPSMCYGSGSAQTAPRGTRWACARSCQCSSPTHGTPCGTALGDATQAAKLGARVSCGPVRGRPPTEPSARVRAMRRRRTLVAAGLWLGRAQLAHNLPLLLGQVAKPGPRHGDSATTLRAAQQPPPARATHAAGTASGCCAPT